MSHCFRKLLIIANPVAQNGEGKACAYRARALLASALGEAAFALEFTERPGQASDIAARAASRGFDCVCALGGDGIANEVACGLMEVPAGERPAFALLPVGSGNDYARTLGMSTDLPTAVLQLCDGELRSHDVGKCNDRWFLETLSFGLDAAIALDTVERRARTGKTGTILYLQSGIDQLLHHMDLRRYTAVLDSGEPVCGESYLFAVQIGQTYGGGFRICPDAAPDDGLFDICIAHPPLTRFSGTFIFLMAKDAHHTRFKQIEFRRAASIDLRFDAPLPVQIDGEALVADSYHISITPRALRVVVPYQGESARS